MSVEQIPPDEVLENVPNISKKGLNPLSLSAGLGNDHAVNRLIFRLNYVETKFEERKMILKNGNLASLEPEIYALETILQDLIDIVREAVTLTAVSVYSLQNAKQAIKKDFQQEQGVATPPSPEIAGTETPPAN